MNNPIVFMFSGQGSQYYHMGKELYENNKVFHYWMNHCSQIAEQFIDESLVDLIYRERANRFENFDQTLYTHPAIFIVEYSLYQVMIELGIKPDYLLGYSIGEYTANIVSGVLCLEEGMSLMHKNASLIHDLTPIASMMAILASQKISENYVEHFSETCVAGINYNNHFVVTGEVEELERLKLFLDKQNITSQILPVTHGFHSHLMDGIEADFKEYIQGLSFGSMQIPIISPVKKKLLRRDDLITDYYYNIVRLPVDFKTTIEQWERSGNYTYIDVGPSGTLANFVKQIVNKNSSSSMALPSLNMFGKDMESILKLQKTLNNV